MQKISSYLYSNRIQAVVNLAASPLEWRIVYQRKFKIYQGLNNVLELDVKNAEQKRIDITTYAMKFVIMDQLNQEICTGDVNTATGIKGLGLITIPSSVLECITPQFLKYTVYILNADCTKTPVYGDTQFGVGGILDYLAGAMPTALPPKIIKTFVYDIDIQDPTYETRIYRSDAVEINPVNDGVGTGGIKIDFMFAALTATVTVQTTTDGVVSTSTHWDDVETFAVANTTTILTKNHVFDSDVNWLRIKYVASTQNNGTIKKVTVSADPIPTITGGDSLGGPEFIDGGNSVG